MQDRLSLATSRRLPSHIDRPPPRRADQVGIVHFGPGAFHRAHQAAYIDRLLRHDPRWGIAAISLRSYGTIDALAQQDGLYTLAIRDAEPAMRIVDAHRRFLGPGAAAETRALLADPAVRLVTTTVTEKGYCLAPDGTLDMAHPDIVRDLTRPEAPASVIGWIVAGLAARRDTGIPAFVPMPCDNLAGNGAKLKAALVAFARAIDPALADWIAGEVRVPSTMVDSITPASDAAFRADVARAIGLEDRAAVQREAFAQWVIEDIGDPPGSDPAPDLGAVGAIVTPDVAGYEQAKLRILNAAHSTLAYGGLLRGCISVADAMRDAPLARFVDAMICRDIVPMLPPVAGLDLDAYRAAILTRFRNPAILHRLDQIAQDGSQKLPYRLGDTLIANRRAGRLPLHIVAAAGCWVAWVMRQVRGGVAIADPAAATLAACASDGSAADVTLRLVDAGIGLPRTVATDPALVAALQAAATAADLGQWNRLFAAVAPT